MRKGPSIVPRPSFCGCVGRARTTLFLLVLQGEDLAYENPNAVSWRIRGLRPVALCALPAAAARQHFERHNHSGHVIKSLYGDSVKVEFDREEDECNWDVKVDFRAASDVNVSG